MSLDRNSPEVVARHEGGHAVAAWSAGIRVTSISIQPRDDSLGRVEHDGLPRPNETDCNPATLWFTTQLRVLLAGDRAVRVAHPLLETANGGPTCDYARAVRLLEATCGADEIQGYLDRHAVELDAFFSRDDIAEQVDVVVRLLLERHTVDGDELRQRFFGNACGALHPDGLRRCQQRPHRAGPHSLRVEGEGPMAWRWETWNGFDGDDRTARSKRSSLHRRVLKVIEPELYPPRKRRDPVLDDLPLLNASVADRGLTERERNAAMRRIIKSLQQRQSDNEQLLPPPVSAIGAQPDVEQHDARCSSVAQVVDDGHWCSFCGFERRRPGARTAYYYQLVERQLVRSVDSDDPFVTEVPRLILPNASDAARHLALLREADGRVNLELRRWPKPS